jgi:hypothetical protein
MWLDTTEKLPSTVVAVELGNRGDNQERRRFGVQGVDKVQTRAKELASSNTHAPIYSTFILRNCCYYQVIPSKAQKRDLGAYRLFAHRTIVHLKQVGDFFSMNLKMGLIVPLLHL